MTERLTGGLLDSCPRSDAIVSMGESERFISPAEIAEIGLGMLRRLNESFDTGEDGSR
ncbi:hypothetical protein [Rhodococcus zopfii]|uniref:hypothetical protein n=1 Tax=Rhodococcus zopfii TaxID=43772 RepID=UPI003527BFB3